MEVTVLNFITEIMLNRELKKTIALLENEKKEIEFQRNNWKFFGDVAYMKAKDEMNRKIGPEGEKKKRMFYRLNAKTIGNRVDG